MSSCETLIGHFGSLHSAFVIPLVAIVHFCLLYKKRASSLSSGISDKMFSLSAEALTTFTDFYFSTDATTWQALWALSNRWTVQTASTSDSGWLFNTLALTSWLLLYGLVFVLLLPPPCLSLCFEHLLQVHLPPYSICIYSLITYTTVFAFFGWNHISKAAPIFTLIW